jgi:saccharopine dehydrogenase-like NADP-dependent oxidoreductase
MVPVLLLGAGKIGGAIARLLAGSGDYDVRVGDASDAALSRLAASPNLDTVRLEVTDDGALRRAMQGRRVVVSACSFDVNEGIARAALEAGLSYFDLTEDVDTTAAVRLIATGAKPGQVFMPQCGLAPGFVSIAAWDLTRNFDKLDEVRLRVGALPQFPTNEMKYNLTWSTDGLINEYGNPCQAIHRGEPIAVLPLEGLEHFSLDGIDYEAFNTSGGVGTLCDTLAGSVRELNYKTIRYRGHRDLMAFLMNELRLNDRRAVLKDILETSVPVTPQDVVLIFCTVSGWKGGRLTQVTDARKIYHGACPLVAGTGAGHAAADGDGKAESWSAIQMTTASSLCAVLDLHVAGKLPDAGFVRQEQVALDDFLANRFGRCYATGQEAGAGMAARV